MGYLDRFRRRAGAGEPARGEPSGRADAPSCEDIVAAAERFGLGRVADALRANILPSLRFDLEPKAEMVGGGTRFGGKPDIPPGMDWPSWRDRPLIFLGQIALRDLADSAVAVDLPNNGLLSFWYAGAEEAWGFDPAEAGASRVVVIPGESKLETRAPPSAFDGPPLACCDWTPRPELRIPPWESSLVERWGLARRNARATSRSKTG